MLQKYAYFFKCFAHPSRNELLKLLAEHGEMTVEQLADASSITASTVSRHLNLMKMQEVVEVRTDPPSHYYSLRGERIRQRFQEFLVFLKELE